MHWISNVLIHSIFRHKSSAMAVTIAEKPKIHKIKGTMKYNEYNEYNVYNVIKSTMNTM